jgi:hypothetical protein
MWITKLFQKKTKSPQETTNPEKDKEILENQKMIREGYKVRLVYEDNVHFYEIADWLNNSTKGRVDWATGYDHELTRAIKRIHVVHFENEDDALFCKIKFPPNYS